MMSEEMKKRVLGLVSLHRSVIAEGGGSLCKKFNQEAARVLLELEEEGLFDLSDRMMDILAQCKGQSRGEHDGICERGRMVQGMLDAIEKWVQD